MALLFWAVHVLAEQQVTGCVLKWLCCLGYNKLLNRVALCSRGVSGEAQTAASLHLTDLTPCCAKGGSVPFSGSHITWLQVSAAELLACWKRTGNFPLSIIILPILNFCVRGKDSGGVGLGFSV